MIRRLRKDARGTAIVEFALCLPFLVMIYIGGYQLSDSVSAYRKVTSATRTIADLTSQYTAISTSDLDIILNASTQILSPYKVASAKLTVSQIYTDANGNSTVSWSRSKNTTALTKSSSFTLPASLKQSKTYLIVAKIEYTYTPIVAAGLIGTIPMQEQIVMGPRASEQVTGVDL